MAAQSAGPPALGDLEAGVRERRAAIRRGLGFGLGATADHGDSEPGLRAVLRTTRSPLYPVAALGLLGVVDTFQGYAFTILTPEISQTLGLSLGALGLARALSSLAQTLAPLPMAGLAQRPGRRALLCIVTAIVWSVVTMFTGFVLSLFALIVVLVVDGLSTGSVAALHPPLVVDSYPVQARVRMLSLYTAITTSGLILSPLLVALLVGPFNLTWRGVFLVMGVASLLTSLCSLGLRDPAPDKADESIEVGPSPAAVGERIDHPELGFFEIMRRLLLIPTVQKLCCGFLVFGILTIPYQTFLASFLDQRWGLDDNQRGLFFAGIATVAVGSLVVFGHLVERLFRSSPARVLDLCGRMLVLAVLIIGVGSLLPYFASMAACFAVGSALIVLLTPGLNSALLSIVHSSQRAHAAALVGIFAAGGGILGAILLGQVETEYGLTGSIISLLVPGIAGGLLIRNARLTVESDLDAMITSIVEEADIAAVQERRERLPMLSTRGISFSYGQLQVLFDVNLTVEEGEMVALLGTNGAGKSTLLKVISGIGLPQAGTVRYQGRNITYLDAERRLRLGITQIPGGKAVFGPLDVVENLRAFGHAGGGGKRDTEEAIERCFEAFPQLRERRRSLASTLSGGQQQMLGLSKALIVRPRLLLIDELSLGLAPVVVGHLLDLVRRVNAEGTAVVLVEQSVNVALSLVDHAYFMEKGEIRFDGPAADLLDRTDLLRAVFLDGAGQGTPL
jgi:ABC-type branched-subunit amino acid transport system ATPase component/sugar phosphate permease